MVLQSVHNVSNDLFINSNNIIKQKKLKGNERQKKVSTFFGNSKGLP